MISFFKVRVYLKRIINNLLSSNKRDIREAIRHRDNTVYGDVDFIINSSVIIHFKKDGRELYFRECQKHLPRREHLNVAIEDYCKNITGYHDKKYLLNTISKDLNEKSNYKKYINNIPQLFDTDLMSILSGEYHDYAYVGLPSFTEIDDHKEFLRFLQYSCCILSIYLSNSYVRYGHLENSNANKQMSTYIVSRLLGLDSLIPKVEVCELNIGGKVRIGTLMEKAEGENVAYTLPEDRKKIAKKTFLKDLTNLEYLDALCYQLDHRLDNYNVVYDEEHRATSVVAFDNDASRTFFPFPSMPKQTYAGASCVVKNGAVNRPYMDKKLSQHIFNISEADLNKELEYYLTKFQRKALWKRISILRKAIEKSRSLNPDFEVGEEHWEDVDDSNELNEKYGKTYYNLYLFDTTMIDREVDFNKRRQCTSHI